MPAVGYVVISTQPSRADAELLAGLLRSGGITVLVEGAVDEEYPTSVAGGYRVTVPADRAGDAQQLLAQAEHIDPADPASSLDVGQPVDDDVRDYLAWKQQAGDDEDLDADDEMLPAHPASPAAVTLAVTGQKARGLPLVPLLGALVLVIALVMLLR